MIKLNLTKRKNQQNRDLLNENIIPEVFKSKDYVPTRSDKYFVTTVIKLALIGDNVNEENVRKTVKDLKL